MRALLWLCILVLALGASGCMFHVEHRLPVDATFGRARSQQLLRTPFEHTKVKRYVLGGTVPWTLSYSHRDRFLAPSPGRRIEELQLETRFSPLDALLRFVPYMGYVLAQRTVKVRGTILDPIPAAPEQ